MFTGTFQSQLRKLLQLIAIYHITCVQTNGPEVTVSVIVLNNNTGNPWGLPKTEKAIEMGSSRLREMLAGLATVQVFTAVTRYTGCHRRDVGAIGAEQYYIRNTSVFIGPGKQA